MSTQLLAIHSLQCLSLQHYTTVVRRLGLGICCSSASLTHYHLYKEIQDLKIYSHADFSYFYF